MNHWFAKLKFHFRSKHLSICAEKRRSTKKRLFHLNSWIQQIWNYATKYPQGRICSTCKWSYSRYFIALCGSWSAWSVLLCDYVDYHQQQFRSNSKTQQTEAKLTTCHWWIKIWEQKRWCKKLKQLVFYPFFTF